MSTRYTGIKGKRVDGEIARGTAIYPEVPASTEDIYLISTSGDRFDILAFEYYGNAKYWWIVASNNPTLDRSTLQITPGVQIRIPLPLERVLSQYKEVNTNR